MRELNIDGCMNFFGAHVKLCITDYALIHRHVDRLEGLVRKHGRNGRKQSALRNGRIARVRIMLNNYETAKNYLFGKGLVDDIRRMELPLSIEYTRRHAQELAESAEFNDTMELGV